MITSYVFFSAKGQPLTPGQPMPVRKTLNDVFVCVPCHGSGNCALKCPRKESCDPILQVSDSQDLKHENWEGLPQQM